MSRPTVTIVVPVLNGAAFIGRCLESLLAVEWPSERLEILVVDNGSTDETRSIVESFDGVRLLRAEKRGAAVARNIGWRAAKSELIAFTDADCTVSPDWLTGLVPVLEENPKVGGVGGDVTPDAPQSVVEEYIIAKKILTQEGAMKDRYLSPPFLVTANAIYRRECLEKVDGFDESLDINGEDADLAWRIQWAGWELKHVPEFEVIHRHRSTIKGLMKQVHSYGCGATALFAKHKETFHWKHDTWLPPYWEAAWGFLRAPFLLVFGRTPLQRMTPLLEGLAGVSFVWGKIKMSFKLRVWHI